MSFLNRIDIFGLGLTNFKIFSHLNKYTVFSEFRSLIMRGNVIDLAVGGVDMAKKEIAVQDVHIGYGTVLQEIFNFVIVAFVLFAIIIGYNKATNANIVAEGA